jgi:hypothetical protein
VQGADRVLRYLARSVHRAAITDARILRVDTTTVTFRYQDAQAMAWRTMTLPGEEFLRRFLQHVLPRGLHKVRDYGWWRPQASAIRAQLQQQLAPPVAAPRPDGPSLATPVPKAPCCPACGTGSLFRTRRLRRVPALARPP